MCEASHMKFDPVCHQISQVYMYENVTSGPSHLGDYSNYRKVLIAFILKTKVEVGKTLLKMISFLLSVFWVAKYNK